MKRIIMFVLLFAALKVAGQTTGYLRFDTVKIMKQNGTCELYVINKTKDSLGVLTNVGGGLTQFKRPRALNDSMIIIGNDTIPVKGVGGEAADPSFYGTIYQKSSWANLSDFTTNGATASITGDSISISGGTNDFTKTIDLNYSTLLNRWKFTTTFTASNIAASPSGAGIGLNGINGWTTHQHDIVAKINLTTGSLTLENNGGAGTYTTVGTSGTTLSVSTNDVIELSIER
jgi:hypothetical protein